jgi:Fe-Mn family superoxide dismutase
VNRRRDETAAFVLWRRHVGPGCTNGAAQQESGGVRRGGCSRLCYRLHVNLKEKGVCTMKMFLGEGWSGALALVPLVGLALAGKGPQAATGPGGVGGAFQLPPLPYSQDALEPYISARTMSFHYGKHHQAYVDNLNKLVAGTPLAGQPLEKIVRETAGAADKVAVFNNAAQDWNHTFFWQSMKPKGGGQPTGRMLELINKSFGSFDGFKKTFVDTGVAQFGSGWVWLVQDGGTLKVVKTGNADTPVAHGQTALLTCDVWEHAYYLDYQNRRKDFIQAFVDHLANWEFAASQLK